MIHTIQFMERLQVVPISISLNLDSCLNHQCSQHLMVTSKKFLIHLKVGEFLQMQNGLPSWEHPVAVQL